MIAEPLSISGEHWIGMRKETEGKACTAKIYHQAVVRGNDTSNISRAIEQAQHSSIIPKEEVSYGLPYNRYQRLDARANRTDRPSLAPKEC